MVRKATTSIGVTEDTKEKLKVIAVKLGGKELYKAADTVVEHFLNCKEAEKKMKFFKRDEL